MPLLMPIFFISVVEWTILRNWRFLSISNPSWFLSTIRIHFGISTIYVFFDIFSLVHQLFSALSWFYVLGFMILVIVLWLLFTVFRLATFSQVRRSCSIVLLGYLGILIVFLFIFIGNLAVEGFTIFTNWKFGIIINGDFDCPLEANFFSWIMKILQIRVLKSLFCCISLSGIKNQQFSQKIHSLSIHSAKTGGERLLLPCRNLINTLLGNNRIQRLNIFMRWSS